MSFNVTAGASKRLACVVALWMALLLPWGEVHHLSHDPADSTGSESCAVCILGQGSVLLPPPTTVPAQHVLRCIGRVLPEARIVLATLPDRSAQPRAPPWLA
jgi:hypothetical protein